MGRKLSGAIAFCVSVRGNVCSLELYIHRVFERGCECDREMHHWNILDDIGHLFFFTWKVSSYCFFRTLSLITGMHFE